MAEHCVDTDLAEAKIAGPLGFVKKRGSATKIQSAKVHFLARPLNLAAMSDVRPGV